jgi:diguanylate cyclase (GGDEF)-like protein
MQMDGPTMADLGMAARMSAGMAADVGQCLQSADTKVSGLEQRVAELEMQVARLQAERVALYWAVGHDELTGLANRRQFYAVAPTILRVHGCTAAVLVLDLNGFKPINDTFGHHVGDEVLRQVARRLALHTGGDLVARLGGDEFAAVLTRRCESPSAYWWQRTAATLSANLAEPMWISGRVLTVTASIGVALAGPQTSIEDLVRRADVAMYQSKAVQSDASRREPGTTCSIPAAGF